MVLFRDSGGFAELLSAFLEPLLLERSSLTAPENEEVLRQRIEQIKRQFKHELVQKLTSARLSRDDLLNRVVKVARRLPLVHVFSVDQEVTVCMQCRG